MATTGILRSRRSVAQLHALASVEREIRANDPSVGRKYLRDFRNAYRSYDRVLSADDVRDAIAAAGIVLVGDYHALPNSQRYVASLLRDPALHRRSLVLGLETVFSRDQHILDEWQRGEIDENELRQRMRFDLDWGYDWEPFYDLLCAAHEHSFPIYGLDCMPREDLRKIGARDRHAADKIAELRGRYPDALILVLFGESHLAPRHLPAIISDRLAERLAESSATDTRESCRVESCATLDLPLLTVLQNVDALYWRAAGEASDRVEAVEVSERVFCVFNATPLEKYENYRICLDRWGRDDDSAPDLGPTFYNLVDGLVRFLGINQYSPHNTTQPRLLVDLMPEVYSRRSNALLRRLLLRRGFTEDDRRSIVQRVRERGCVYLAPLNAVYVRQFRMTSAAEDATRFLHQACRGLPYRTGANRPVNGNLRAHASASSAEDIFFTAVFENALAFFGSRVLYPARPAFREEDLAELYEVTREDFEQQTGLPFGEGIALLNLTMQLREADCPRPQCASDAQRGCDRPRTAISAVSAALAQALALTGGKQQYIAERLGYLAGNDLYDAYVQGRLTPAALRKLFLAHIDEPGAARAAYAELLARLK